MHHSESIIISKIPLREADLLVTFFSRADGKIKGVARHAKKSRKRFGGLLETGYVIDLSYTSPSKAGSDLVRIDQASAISPKRYTSQTLESTTATWLALEFASRFLPDAEANGEKFELIKRFVTAIHGGRLTRPILLFFLLKWISLSGYLPDFKEQVSMPGLHYKFKKGSLDTLRSIVAGNINCDINDPVFEDLLRFIFQYCMAILGRPLKLEGYLPILMDV